MSNAPIVKIKNQDYKLKVTLGLYKRMSFPREEMQSIYTNGAHLLEILKLAIYFGNKADKSWNTLEDLGKVITDQDLEDLDDNNISEKIGTAIFKSLPDSVQKAIKGTVEEGLDDSKKK